jgi:hypothetical protein
LLLVIVSVLVTGLVWPGWMRGSGAASKAGTSAPVLANSLVAAINRHDSSALHDLACDNADPSVSRYDQLILRYQAHAQLDGPPQVNGGAAVAKATVTAGGQTRDYLAALSQHSDSGWCVLTIRPL